MRDRQAPPFGHEARHLRAIRQKLFHGAADYTKNLPDFHISENLQLCRRRFAVTFLDRLRTSLSEEPELLAYVHLPFCVTECLFCNTSPNPRDGERQRAYLTDLMAEIEAYGEAGVFEGKRLRSVFLGGGTPTTFSDEELRRCLEQLRRFAPLSPGGSVTIEATPLSLAEPGRLEGLRRAGATRISLGCQSFDPAVIALCNRSHSVSELRDLVEGARGLGLTTNLDLMLGLPGQTASSVRRDLEALEQIRPDSVAFIRHELVNERMIRLLAERPELRVDDDELFEMTLLAHCWSDDRGYERSGRLTGDAAFPYRRGWLRELPLLAFGARTRSATKELFWESPDDLELYGKVLRRRGHAVFRCQTLSKVDQMYRTLFLGLQLAEGVDRRRFAERFGVDVAEAFSHLLPELEAIGCVEIDERSLRLSELGSVFVEDVCCLIIDAALKREYPGLVRAPFASSRSGLDPWLSLLSPRSR